MKSFFDLREKTLTPAEKKKREEIAKAMERENPGMDMSKKMAIATAQAKKVAEEVEQVDELNRSTLSNYMHKASDAQKHKDMPTAKVDKRYSGVAKAAKKLDKMNNEEVELTDDQLFEAVDKQAMRLKQLAKSGLVDKSDVDKLMLVIKRMRNGDTLSVAQKDMLINLVDELVGIVTGDPSIFQKAKKAVAEAVLMDKFSKHIEEKAEQVDELNVGTLRSYIKKAGDAMKGRSKKSMANIPKRMGGKMRALDRLAGYHTTKLKPGEKGRPFATHKQRPYKAEETESNPNRKLRSDEKKVGGEIKRVAKPPFDGPYKKPGSQSATAGKFGQGHSTAKHLARMGLKQFMSKDKK